jgi:8-oxo-dGTP pyrophosphatase MutT (NUDIX family)
MKLLAEISDKSLGISDVDILDQNYLLRKSARAILLNKKNEVCLQHVGKNDYYKLPGGGIKKGETEEEALKREIREEVGCDSIIKKEIGITIEYRNANNLLHISYGYIAKVDGNIFEPQYEKDEIENEFKSVWVTIDKAIELLDRSFPKDVYRAQHIVTRERIFLKEAKKLLD